MPFNYFIGKQHKRSRLRKRNPYRLESYRFKQYFPPQTLRVYHGQPPLDKDRMLPSRYTVGQTWGALHKAWLAYCIAVNKNEDEKTLLYASIIQKLQRELGIQVREFAEVDMFGSAIDKEESKLAVIDPFTNEKIQDAKEDEDDYREVNFESL
ncbi:hypothetical protein BH18THE2_BH18THE2_35810 [soil metagenome]